MLRIELLGDVSISIDGENITKSFSTKGIALLAILATSPNARGESRTKLTDFLWPECSPDKAKYNLRHTLWSIRKTFQEHGLGELIAFSKDRQYCRLTPHDNIYIDVNRFAVITERLEGSDLSQSDELMEIFRDAFLNDLVIKECMRFDDWLIYQREKFDRMYYEAVYKAADDEAERGSIDKSLKYLNRLLRANPLDEQLYRRLIELNISKGNKSEAIKYFERCKDILRQELNISPSRETSQLIETLEAELSSTQEMKVVCDCAGDDFPYTGIVAIAERILDAEPNLIDRLPEHMLGILNTILPHRLCSVELGACSFLMCPTEVYDLHLFRTLDRLIQMTGCNVIREALAHRDSKYEAFWRYKSLFEMS